jgi:DNA-directed RNA polymerase
MSGPTPIIHHTILLNKEGEREDAVDLDAEQISLVLDRSKKIAAIIRANIGVRKSRVIDETDTCNPKLMRQVLKILYSSDWPSGPALESSYFTRLCRAFQIFECDRSLLQQCKQVNDVREEWKAEYEESNTELDARHEAAMSRVLTALYLDWDDVLHEAASDLILFNRDDASDLESIIPMGSNGRSIEGTWTLLSGPEVSF